jgi:hypothetical protein
MIWTLGTLLEHVQELVGEPAGGFYNLSSRKRQLNNTQREMVFNTRALQDHHTFNTVIDQVTYALPNDWLGFDKEQPFIKDVAGNQRPLEVKDMKWLDEVFPGWKDGGTQASKGTPQYISYRKVGEVLLWPIPNKIEEVTIPYIPDPDEMEDFDDAPFNGSVELNRYAQGLAYKVAAIFMMSRVPQLGDQYLRMAGFEEARMRASLQSNPQNPMQIRPESYKRRGRYAFRDREWR